MGRAVVQCLNVHKKIEPTALARLLAKEYHREPTRGYGTIAHTILDEIWQGRSWQQAAGAVFDGKGSFGNGAAMRAAPIGAYFAEDTWRVIDESRRSAMVTHAHVEGQAGAIAVALAAAWVVKAQDLNGRIMLDWVWTHTPHGETRDNLERALNFSLSREPKEAAALLGSGERVTAQDTVPFALWCAARHLDSYSDALWSTVTGGGDMDTTCAIVGSIVALCAPDGIPKEWKSRTEPVKLVLEPWWSQWDGWISAKKMAPEGANRRRRLFDAASANNWPSVFLILDEQRETSPNFKINSIRLDDPTWYSLLHYAVQGDAPVEVMEELLAKGHFRSIRCKNGERPVDTAKRLDRTDLVPLLNPLNKHDIPKRKLAILEDQFHQLIHKNTGLSKDEFRFPPLEVLLERDDLTMSFFVSNRFGGFVYRLAKVGLPLGFDATIEDWVLLTKDFDRMGDTEHFYLVTPYGSLLVSKGHEDKF